MEPNAGLSPLRGLAKLRRVKTRRFSSFDRTGGNDDRFHVLPGQTVVIAETAGAGIVTHMWMTTHCPSPHYLRKLTLRAYWDGEPDPSVECPFGDFFGMGHAQTKNFISLPLQMSPEEGRAFNCYFPMPFERGMRMTITNESDQVALFYYYVDLELHDRLEPGLGRFHAQWRRAEPKQATTNGESNESFEFGGVNTDGRSNYKILEAAGHGHYVGCLYSVYNLRRSAEWDWYGEGDDMIFIDGEPGFAEPDVARQSNLPDEPPYPKIAARTESAPKANDAWPPTLHGTGTEDYFNCAWCPTQEYNGAYHGVISGGGPNWTDPVTVYRFHIEDPIVFQNQIRVSIERGHANKRWDDITSVAFWYQAEPHTPFPAYLPVEQRLPIFRAPFEQR
jgi:D-arabinan exo alpha-(1,3)/(1,5)-arabinofuranosidase (non-reducing end)